MSPGRKVNTTGNGVFQACLIRNLNVYKISSVVQQQQNATSLLHICFALNIYIKTRGGQTDDPLKSAFIYNTISHPSLNVYCLDSLSMKTILFDCVSAFQCVYISRRNLSARIIDGLIETFFKILKLIAWLPHHIAFPSSIRHTGQTSNKRESPFCKKILTIYTVVLCTYYRLFEDNFKRIGKLYG